MEPIYQSGIRRIGPVDWRLVVRPSKFDPALRVLEYQYRFDHPGQEWRELDNGRLPEDVYSGTDKRLIADYLRQLYAFYHQNSGDLDYFLTGIEPNNPAFTGGQMELI